MPISNKITAEQSKSIIIQKTGCETIIFKVPILTENEKNEDTTKYNKYETHPVIIMINILNIEWNN